MNNDITEKKSFFKKPWVQSVAIIIIIFGALGGFLFWQSTKNIVSIDTSFLDAPVSVVSAASPGILNAIYVQDGDVVKTNQQIALVGSETIYAQENGIIANAPAVVGSFVGVGQQIASIIVNEKMRVIGSIDETKGLDKIVPGQHVTFTVDAFPGKTYEGVVDRVGPLSNDEGVVFSISDKRPIKKFNVYVNFVTSQYPELKSGMSAKMKINTSI